MEFVDEVDEKMGFNASWGPAASNAKADPTRILFKCAMGLKEESRAAKMVSRGANVNSYGTQGLHTLVHLAVLRNKPDFLEFMLGFHAGAIFNARDYWGSTPLQIAEEAPQCLGQVCIFVPCTWWRAT